MTNLEEKLIELGYERRYITKKHCLFERFVKRKPICIFTDLAIRKIINYYVLGSIPNHIRTTKLPKDIEYAVIIMQVDLEILKGVEK